MAELQQGNSLCRGHHSCGVPATTLHGREGGLMASQLPADIPLLQGHSLERVQRWLPALGTRRFSATRGS